MDRMERQHRTPRTPAPDPRPLGPRGPVAHPFLGSRAPHPSHAPHTPRPLQSVATHLAPPPLHAPPSVKATRAHFGHSGHLVLPARLTAGLGCDAVGTPREHGRQIMDSLPRVGCVFADDQCWWWIVPSGSHIGVTWPPGTRYVVGAQLADPSWTRTRPASPSARPRLIHSPEGDSPYTPPIPLYVLACRLAGSVPSWSPGMSG
ncbi:hypothetical protein ACKI1I_16335 [Streptomyces turgidiscabies]|uniref:Uncharacterized protein n=1 Tax=Streptomyces turgidiscabies (strain Car8) TaxID=698760 RepID=L7F7B4_STRT8|nr:hypothetical protein [Streptomyces turgidiscabies]ELP67493.1 hypothetical protein STRTUCAR8_08385 [Streptomyces turgidiscabies Car8]MDX3495104.1 hypothetical protein [Streptomyces turgidiscabies]GAQ70977.1 hypothetical protein T45_02719 [Streptomyces turgidiscabies]